MNLSPGTIVNKLQHVLARSPIAVSAAVKLMNQCRLVIGYHLTATCDSALNGEEAVMDTIAPHVRVFVDVGANVGDWTQAMLRRTERNDPARGLLVEPTSSLAAGLRERFAGNTQLTIEECALGVEPGTATFFVSEENSEHSSLVMEDESRSRKVTVKVDTLDRLMAAHQLSSVDFVKIDTEGNDFNVLLGAREALARQAIHAIQFEYGNNWKVAGHTLHGAIRHLKASGYSCHLIAAGGLVEYDLHRYGELFLYSNFLALSDQGRAWFASLIH